MASRTPNQGGLGPCHFDDGMALPTRGHNTNTRTGLAPAPTEATAVNTLVAALRRELHTPQTRYQAQIAELTATLKDRDKALAAAHGELQRLNKRRELPALS